ncbi:MAG: DUF4430 domain-containing protein [Bacillota bacterium]|nr:DUF4430 domain-containing protein [Bacillota bacterium]
METKAKKKTFNIIMVALIAVIAVCGIMLVGHIQGWFGGGSGSSSDMVCEEISGVVNVERSGVGYSLEKDVAIEAGDIVETKNGSEAIFNLGKNNIAVNENTEMEIPTCGEGSLDITLNEGEFFAEVPDAPDSFTIDFGKNKAMITGTVFSVSQQKNSSTLDVFEGTVTVTAEDGSENTVSAGQELLIARNAKDKLSVETSDLQATFLSDYMINKLLACDTSDLCFDADALNKVITAREKEKKQAAKALEQEAIEIASNEENAASGSGDTSGGSSDIMTCTIQIQCKSILKNMDKLASGKNRYVPSNGVILSTSSVQFQKGETAYDVTKRACSATGIQIEASYVPLYGSYYVEGINHLYEFDCGEMSGWLYKVNGWAPNYGCSEYKLKNGDSIVWTYTCTGR